MILERLALRFVQCDVQLEGCCREKCGKLPPNRASRQPDVVADPSLESTVDGADIAGNNV